MNSHTSVVFAAVLLLLTSLSMPIAASSPERTADKFSHSEQQFKNESNKKIVNVVITLSNFTARENISFESNITITGGKDIQLMPVLFAKTTISTIPRIESNPHVQAVQIDHEIQGPTQAADYSTETQNVTTAARHQTIPWSTQRVGTQNISDRLRKNGTQNITIAIIDDGIDYTHPDLKNKVVWGANFTGTHDRYGLETTNGNNGHGTAVAGIIAAKDNKRGIVGIAPGVQLYSIQTLDQSNTGSITALIKGLNAAVEGPDGTIGTEDDADIIQISAGTAATDEQLAAATTSASESAIIVSSVGNRGDGNPDTEEVVFPAEYQETIAVAATDKSDRTTIYSSEGDAVDVAAPGNQVTTLSSGTGTRTFVGTSAATPHVSGMIALLLAADGKGSSNSRTKEEFRSLVIDTARDIENSGSDPFSGSGLIQIDKAVTKILADATERTSSRKVVTGGETVTITRTTYASQPHLTVSESFEPSVSTVDIQKIAVNGNTTKPSNIFTNNSRAVISFHNLKIGDKITVTYTIQLPNDISSNNTYHIENGNQAKNINTDGTALELTAQPSASANNSRGYDEDNNGKIDLAELSKAAEDYANDKISLGDLAQVAQEYVN